MDRQMHFSGKTAAGVFALVTPQQGENSKEVQEGVLVEQLAV